jgi:hypothetical protein
LIDIDEHEKVTIKKENKKNKKENSGTIFDII